MTPTDELACLSANLQSAKAAARSWRIKLPSGATAILSTTRHWQRRHRQIAATANNQVGSDQLTATADRQIESKATFNLTNVQGCDRVVDANNNPVAGVIVNFAAPGTASSRRKAQIS